MSITRWLSQLFKRSGCDRMERRRKTALEILNSRAKD